jgi:tRNA (guanine-N7-)-methyltransferase
VSDIPKRERPRRTVRSYVRGRGRITSGQRKALDRHWLPFGIGFSAEPLDLDAVFGRVAPRVLDIGSGMGETTVKLALAHPENDYLAIEVHQPGVGSLLRRAAEARVQNLRVIAHDAVEVLRRQIPDRSLDEAYVFFPDPWPKKRHHKRRLVSKSFLALLVPRLKSHARLCLATDWPDLAEHMLKTCDAFPGLENLAGKGCFAPRPAWRPATKFERRGARLDHVVRDLVYSPAPSSPSKDAIAVKSRRPRAGR